MRGSKARRAIIGLLIGVIGLELCLQILAFGVWLGRPDTAPASTGQRTVLCVGDSFTYGMGATAPATTSYPAILGGELDPKVWRVVKEAWPARNSREVLFALNLQLETLTPERVYILAGMNDIWTQPKRVERDELATLPATSFRLTYRTGRLLVLIAHALLPADDPNTGPVGEVPGFVGVWHKPGFAGVVLADGRFELGGLSGRWRLEQGRLIVRSFKSKEVEVDWRLRDDKLEFRSELWSEPVVLSRGAGPDGQRMAIYESSIRNSGELGSVLAHNLRLMAAMCRERGAEPVFLSYPWGCRGINGVARATAAELEIDFLDTIVHFKPMVPRRDLMVTDGHCNDRGYAVLGRFVAADVLARRK